jgi:uncharacterized protein GlcG (DUF336 family)
MKFQAKKLAVVALAAASVLVAGAANAKCSDITRAQLQSALNAATGTAGGFTLPMWMTFVDETGMVCEVVTSGATGALASRTEWLGSRVISAQKANTANAFSINGVSISTGALYAAVQPGGSLFGLQESNPVDAEAAYRGNPRDYGTANDPMKYSRVGGVNVFGGGIAVYKNGVKVGALGVSGDTSCTDHATVWAARAAIPGTDAPKADFPAGGGFETLHFTSTYAALGDHPHCAFDTSIDANSTFGTK